MGHDHPDMLWRAEATEHVLDRRDRHLDSQATEDIELGGITGRVLAGEIVAGEDVPAMDHATMDGYAFDASEPYPFEILEPEIYPEDTPPSLEQGQAIRIATGAPLPPEANAVLKREEATVSDGELSGPPIEPGTYAYQQGTNVSAGERLFDRGESLSAKDAILLRDLGHERVTVFERFSVGILATGTEIHEERQSDLDSLMLSNLVRSWGHRATYEGTVPDEYDRVETRIREVAEAYDVVLTTGGTSVGHKDHVITALENLGTVHFHRVRIRPGKPIAMATIGEDTVAFAIPGKPVGAHTIATLVMRPFFTGDASLPTIESTFTADVSLAAPEFEYAIPVILEEGEAMPLGHHSSPLQIYEGTFDPSVLSSSTRATRAEGFVLTEEAVSEGQTVDVVPYPAVE